MAAAAAAAAPPGAGCEDCVRGPEGGRWEVGDVGVGVEPEVEYDARAASSEVVEDGYDCWRGGYCWSFP